MKNNKILVLFSLVILSIVGCSSTDEKFSGSPVGAQTITTLTGTIATDATFALSGQDIEFTASLPEGKTFTDTVTVEVTARRGDGGRIRDYYDILPGTSSVTGKIGVVQTLLYDQKFELFMSAIHLQTVEPGIHYLMTSNKVTIDGGSTTIPDPEADRLIVRFAWDSPSALNKFKLWIDKPDGSATDISSTYGGVIPGIQHVIRIEAPGAGNNEGASQSFREGEYIFKLSGDKQVVSPEDKKYRILVVWPTGEVKIFQGTYFGLTPTSPKLPVLKVTKTGVGVDALYTADLL